MTLHVPTATILLGLIAQHAIGQAAYTHAEPLPLSRLFPVQVDTYEGRHFLSVEPDSMRGHAVHEAPCSALWAYHMYLFDNYSGLYQFTAELAELRSDTAQLNARYHSLMEADTAFQQVMGPIMHGTHVPPLHLDSALRIAARFYYVHKEGDQVVTHVCSGINKVKDMGTTVADAHHAAFCYMAIRNMDDLYGPYMPVVEPYRKELRKNPAEARIREVEAIVYAEVARSTLLREALIHAYDRTSVHLPFVLIQ